MSTPFILWVGGPSVAGMMRPEAFGPDDPCHEVAEKAMIFVVDASSAPQPLRPAFSVSAHSPTNAAFPSLQGLENSAGHAGPPAELPEGYAIVKISYNLPRRRMRGITT
ncbi:hypothetical protein [Noviherbaspirillum galbum]|uniref:Uncharacterized protein n=1 Tax=Noviherbaspirillum galbum TaxID=2709383 RepID=A0A6B3SQL2_9BURK|nr:hypothetical protein [Noviherbaspirillum galbum]NEX60702.1 hypothetical protein [Noviherbaspirillum galbum]